MKTQDTTKLLTKQRFQHSPFQEVCLQVKRLPRYNNLQQLLRGTCRIVITASTLIKILNQLLLMHVTTNNSDEYSDLHTH